VDINFNEMEDSGCKNSFILFLYFITDCIAYLDLDLMKREARHSEVYRPKARSVLTYIRRVYYVENQKLSSV
jgi:hypothetical protein